MITPESIVDEVNQSHFAQIPFTVPYIELENAATLYLSFLSLPDEIKDTFTLLAGQEHNYGLLGYKRRSKKTNVKSDNKEFFHYHPKFEEYFKENPHKNLPEVKNFLEIARRIDEVATLTLKNLLISLSERYPNVLNEYFPSTPRRTVLRFLKYDVSGKGNFLARGHYDAGGCTLALAESSPGLRIGTTEKDLKLVVRKPNSALFMPAIYFHTVSDKTFHPVWHDVVQVSEDTLSDSIARWAIVFFADGDSQKTRPTSEEIFTPRQFF